MTSLVLLALLAASPPPGDATARALAAYREGRCGEARPLLAAVLVREPRNGTLRRLLADCLVREGRTGEARAELERVLADNPEDGDAREALRAALGTLQAPEQERQEKLLDSREAAGAGLETRQSYRAAEALLAQGRDGEARTALAEIVGRDPGFAPAVQRLAEVYSEEERFDDAARLYRALHEREPGRAEWLLRAARNYQWAEDAPAAVEMYEAYLKRRPRDDDARQSLADTKRGFGLCHEALPIYERLVEARPADARLHLSIALCHDQLGHADLAIDAFLRVLELDPENAVAKEARRRRERDFDELPRRRAYAAIEQGDLAAAARQLEGYVAKHPGNDVGLRELAEVYAWDERHADAERLYLEYLERVPDDDLALRALARTQSWGGRLAEARASYERLVERGKARPSDYEALVDVLLWSDDLEAAEPYARRLLELEPGSDAAQRVLAGLHAGRVERLRQEAEQLETARRFGEARDAYERYLREHGPDPQIERRRCDLLSWSGEHRAAVEAYREYLRRHPDDVQAELGLASSLAWSGDPAAALPHYESVLAERPADPVALVGLAQAKEAAGSDPFSVREAWRRAADADAESEVARRGLAQARLRTAPALEVEEREFADSDGFHASVLEAGARFALPRAFSLAPFYRLRLFRQSRVVAGEGEAIDGVNELLAARDGRFTGQGFGVRARLGSGRSRVLAEGGYTWYEGRQTPTALAELRLGTGPGGSFALSWKHDDAITEVNTVASLAAGVVVDVAQASAERTLWRRVRLWGAGAVAWYSEGGTPALPGSISANRQLRGSLAAAVLLGPTRVGYAFRETGFERRSPLYFSPSRYRVHSLQLAADARWGAFEGSLDAQAGLAEVDGFSNEEWAVLASAGFRMSDRTRLVLSGRLSRSSEGFDVDRPYDARGLQVFLERLF